MGIGDCYKVGLWTQVEVTVLGGDESFEGELSLVVPDGDGVPSRVVTPPAQPCILSPGRETKVRLLCRFGRVNTTLTAELRAGGKLVARRTFETASKADADHFLPGIEFQKLIVTIGPEPVGVEEAGKLGGAEPAYRPASARVVDVADLPMQWCGYEGVDAVILATSRPELFEAIAADGPQWAALDQWVQMGGKLILSVGSSAERVLGEGSPLRRFAPGRLEKMYTLRQTGALEIYCGSRSPISPATDSKTRWPAPRLVDVRGIVEAREADLPLVVRTPHGFGQITFLAADLDLAPLSMWSDRPMLVAKLLNLPTRPSDDLGEGGAMMHFGFGDISGQLRSALDRFEGVRLAPFWFVAGLIAVYLLLIGPGDYFFLRKVVGRMTWTWISFPLIVLLAGVGAYALAFHLKGDRVKVSQADLIDIDAASGWMRGTTWLNLFSPAMESYDLAVVPCGADGKPAGDAPIWLAWMGLPGGALGGMNPRTTGPAQWTEPYCFTPSLDAMDGVPIQVWSSKSFTARWCKPTDRFPKAELADAQQLLVGKVANTLGFPLEDCILAYGQSVYELGTIGPGESVSLGTGVRRSELKTLLTGQKFVLGDNSEKFRQESTPYDPSSVDIPYILRTMMFYEAAGGQRYTGLRNDYQQFVDLSDLLADDRAILVARGSSDGRGAALLRDGRPLDAAAIRHTTVYRFVLPVKKSDENQYVIP